MPPLKIASGVGLVLVAGKKCPKETGLLALYNPGLRCALTFRELFLLNPWYDMI